MWWFRTCLNIVYFVLWPQTHGLKACWETLPTYPQHTTRYMPICASRVSHNCIDLYLHIPIGCMYVIIIYFLIGNIWQHQGRTVYVINYISIWMMHTSVKSRFLGFSWWRPTSFSRLTGRSFSQVDFGLWVSCTDPISS